MTETSSAPSAPTVVLVHGAFADASGWAGVIEEQAEVTARSQRPVSVAAFAEKTGAPAWRKLPSWAVVGTKDKAASAVVWLRRMAQGGTDLPSPDDRG
jgi:hypothetical protein